MDKWQNINDSLPKDGDLYWVKSSDNEGLYMCNYRKVLTWKGFKNKFTNILGKGWPIDNVTHWIKVKIPNDPITN